MIDKGTKRGTGGWYQAGGRRFSCVRGFRGVAIQCRDALEADEPLAFRDADETNTLRVASYDRNLVDGRPHEGAARGDQHDFVVMDDLQRSNHFTVAIRRLQRDDALAPAALRRKVLHRRELAEAVLRGGENVTVADDDQGIDPLRVAEAYAPDARGFAAHGAHFVFVKANGLAAGREQHDFALSIGERDADQLVVGSEIDRDDAARARAGKCR